MHSPKMPFMSSRKNWNTRDMIDDLTEMIKSDEGEKRKRVFQKLRQKSNEENMQLKIDTVLGKY
jgi:hypothetical protein